MKTRISKADKNFRLVKTLTANEKRNFKVYANRHFSSDENKYVLYFDYLESLETYDEELAKEYLLTIVKPSQYDSTKFYFYNLVLDCIASYSVEGDYLNKTFRQIERGRILMDRDLHFDAIAYFEKAIEYSEKIHSIHLKLICLEYLIFCYSHTSKDQMKPISALFDETKLVIEQLTELNNIHIELDAIKAKFFSLQHQSEVLVSEPKNKHNLRIFTSYLKSKLVKSYWFDKDFEACKAIVEEANSLLVKPENLDFFIELPEYISQINVAFLQICTAENKYSEGFASLSFFENYIKQLNLSGSPIFYFFVSLMRFYCYFGKINNAYSTYHFINTEFADKIKQDSFDLNPYLTYINCFRCFLNDETIEINNALKSFGVYSQYLSDTAIYKVRLIEFIYDHESANEDKAYSIFRSLKRSCKLNNNLPLLTVVEAINKRYNKSFAKLKAKNKLSEFYNLLNEDFELIDNEYVKEPNIRFWLEMKKIKFNEERQLFIV